MMDRFKRTIVGNHANSNFVFGHGNWRFVRGVCLIGAMFLVSSGAWPARAETLKSAMAAAYRSNPQLDAERARLRATDEDIQRARAGWAPTLRGEANLGATDVRSCGQANTFTRSSNLGVTLTQPVFTGFRTSNAVSEAEANVRAGRAQLRDVEGQLLLDVAMAYLNVVRDRELVRLGQDIVDKFTRELRLVKVRLRVGEVTNTDVDQAHSRLARGVATLEQFKGDLRGSQATLERLIGRSVRTVANKGHLIGDRPKTLSAAMEVARRENALVERALYREQAARFLVSKERSELMPRFDVEAGYRRSYTDTGSSLRTDSAEVLGRLSVPLYEGGGTRARIRQVKHLHVSLLQEVEQARRVAVNDLRVAWSALNAAREKLNSDLVLVRYVESALKGVRGEERVGQRTLLDVLNAEEEVFQAKVSVTGDRRDLALAHFQVLRAMGRLDVQSLGLDEMVYDPELHYTEAKSKWLTTSIAQDNRLEGRNVTAIESQPVDVSPPAMVTSATSGQASSGTSTASIPLPAANREQAVGSRLATTRSIRRKRVTRTKTVLPTRRAVHARKIELRPTQVVLRGRQAEVAKVPEVLLRGGYTSIQH
jgi:outer membrane protein